MRNRTIDAGEWELTAAGYKSEGWLIFKISAAYFVWSHSVHRIENAETGGYFTVLQLCEQRKNNSLFITSELNPEKNLFVVMV